MSNVAACLADGYSSAGTAGHGLGAVIRQSHFVDIGSWPGIGTAVLARVSAGTADPARRHRHAADLGRRLGRQCRARTSAAIPGAFPIAGGVRTLLVADGLGHGPEAAEAAVEAVRLFHRYNGHTVPDLLEYIHGGLARHARRRGLDRALRSAGQARSIFSGIGNVAGVIARQWRDSDGWCRCRAPPGFNARKIQSFEYPFEPAWSSCTPTGLRRAGRSTAIPISPALHPTLIAAVLYRDLTRHRDDATVLVAKW